MKTKANDYYAYFTVTGDFDPKGITARLSLEPSDSWTKGDRNERTHFERKFSRWSLNSRLDHALSLEEHVDDVLGQLELASNAVRMVSVEFEAYMQLVGHFYSSYPGLHFTASALARLGELNLDMDMDFYYLYSDKREDS